jgi:hypothetical protein
MEIANFIQKQVRIFINSIAIGKNSCAANGQNLHFPADLLKIANIRVANLEKITNIICDFRLNLGNFAANHKCKLGKDNL